MPLLFKTILKHTIIVYLRIQNVWTAGLVIVVIIDIMITLKFLCLHNETHLFSSSIKNFTALSIAILVNIC